MKETVQGGEEEENEEENRQAPFRIHQSHRSTK